MSSSLTVRFTVRAAVLPRIAQMLGDDPMPVFRLVEFDPVSKKGLAWYMTTTHARERVRCVHEPLDIESQQDLATRMLAWVREGSLTNGWPEDMPTCLDAGTCDYTIRLERLHAE